MIQGLCLGGEYGGAITYVAEHVSDARRGFYTGWLQTSPTLGIVVALAVVLATRGYFGDKGVDEWARRVPFRGSFLLVGIAIYRGLQLGATPIFEEITGKVQRVREPWRQGLGAGRRVPGGVLPGPHPLHVGVGTLSYRQRLGRRPGAVHHVGGVRGDRQPLGRTALSDRRSRGVLRPCPFPDAGNAAHQHLGTAQGKSRFLAGASVRGPRRPRTGSAFRAQVEWRGRRRSESQLVRFQHRAWVQLS